MAQHPFGVIAGGLRLDHRRRPRRVEAGEQYRRFDLGRGHRERIDDRDRIGGAADRERQSAALPRHEARPETAQRVDNAVHRPAPQRRVAGDERGDRVRRQHAKEEPRRGSRIAEIEQVFRLGERPDANAVDIPSAIT